jgi:hypothetical protein
MGDATLRGRRYVLLDASVLIDYFISDPRKVRSSGRINTIVESVRKRAVDEVVLLIPNVCIPEVFGAFAKHALSTWNRQSLRLDRRRYRTLRDAFRRYLHNGAVFQQYELTRYHVLATDLIAPSTTGIDFSTGTLSRWELSIISSSRWESHSVASTGMTQ